MVILYTPLVSLLGMSRDFPCYYLDGILDLLYSRQKSVRRPAPCLRLAVDSPRQRQYHEVFQLPLPEAPGQVPFLFVRVFHIRPE